MYNNLDIKCRNHTNCKSTVKLIDLEKHEIECCAKKCENHEACKKAANGSSNYCSLECNLHCDI